MVLEINRALQVTILSFFFLFLFSDQKENDCQWTKQLFQQFSFTPWHPLLPNPHPLSPRKPHHLRGQNVHRCPKMFHLNRPTVLVEEHYWVRFKKGLGLKQPRQTIEVPHGCEWPCDVTWQGVSCVEFASSCNATVASLLFREIRLFIYMHM